MTQAIFCAAGCKSSVADLSAAESAGWSCLQITSRWRCGTCERVLRTVQSVALNSTRPDLLPPHSIGALKKLPEAVPLHEKVGKNAS